MCLVGHIKTVRKGSTWHFLFSKWTTNTTKILLLYNVHHPLRSISSYSFFYFIQTPFCFCLLFLAPVLHTHFSSRHTPLYQNSSEWKADVEDREENELFTCLITTVFNIYTYTFVRTNMRGGKNDTCKLLNSNRRHSSRVVSGFWPWLLLCKLTASLISAD